MQSSSPVEAHAAVLGDPLDPNTQIGPIASKSEYEKILTYIESGRQSKAKFVAGGGTRKIDGKGLLIEPTLTADATNDLQSLGRKSSDREATREPGDLCHALKLAGRVKAGTVSFNTGTSTIPTRRSADTRCPVMYANTGELDAVRD